MTDEESGYLIVAIVVVVCALLCFNAWYWADLILTSLHTMEVGIE